ncbi:MFS transporter [Agrococcus versicolor]|uniref:MFS transporter n=1 Tax=Agrococcus versicolor TaxID=501482 RepID=A0ABN3AIJ1_9MICO
MTMDSGGDPTTGRVPIVPPVGADAAAAADQQAGIGASADATAQPGPIQPEPRRKRFVDLEPLRASPAFARLWTANAISGIGSMVTVVAVGLQIYDITESTLAVSLVGPIGLLPMIVAGLWGGMLADAFDRKRVLLVSATIGWLSVLGIVAASAYDAWALDAGQRVEVWPFYVLATVNAVAATVSGATRSAITPRIVPAHLISRAAALNGIAVGSMVTIGPALAGVLAATVGLPLTFAVDAVLFSVAFVGILGLPAMPPIGQVAKPGLQSLRDGMRFLRGAPNIRMSFVVDIIAMLFGRANVLFPAVGALVIGGGPITVGVLTAAGAVGTLVASILSGPVAQVHRHGLAVQRAIMVYGTAAALLGLVLLGTTLVGVPVTDQLDGVAWPALVLACLAMAGMGASDEISAIFRSTMLLQAAPDEMRGRLQGVFTIVVAGGPRLGDLYAGLTASLLALWFPPLLGGLLIVALVVLVTRMQGTFLEYDARTPTP